MDLIRGPIGRVRNAVDGPEHPEWSDIESELVIDPQWREALEGVERLERVTVLWGFDRRAGQVIPMQVHPRGDPNRPLTGIFATRAPIRPNLIAVTVVELLGREGNIVRVRGLDAYNGSPILDLKSA